ncbi:MAG: GntR family transcriptional regulator [Chloroflexota bacterium]
MAALVKTEGIPLYVQIRNTLRDDILNQVLLPGQKLPSEDELAARFNVSRMTVRQGVADLIDDGLLYRRHGVGTFVAHPHIERDHSHLSNFVETARTEGIDLRVRLLSAEVTQAKLRVARALSLPEGELVIRVQTLRETAGAPITLHDSYVPYRLFPQLLQENLETKHLWEIFESYGKRVRRAVEIVEARQVDDELAGLLGMAEGDPILYKERTVFLDDGTPVDFSFCFNRGDRYRLTVVLDR